MARPSKNAAIDYTAAHDLTFGLLDRASCPEGQRFVLVKDSLKKGLRLRVTKAGGKHWQFETRLRSGQLFTRALGEWPTISIEQARQEAHELRGLTEKGIDPREAEREQAAVKLAEQERVAAELEAQRAREAAQAVLVGEAWSVYIEERRPYWGARHLADHERLAKAGGEKPKNRRKAETIAGPIHPLLGLRLSDLTPEKIETWAKEEVKTRPTVARLAWRCLKAFLNWCAEHSTYSSLLVTANPAKTKRTREALGKAKVKKDVLQREQLAVWFDAVTKLPNPTVSAYLQTLLLTGARPGEVLALRWKDINTQWKTLSLRDKVEVEDGRTIPLTAYVSHLLTTLPRRNQWVFASPRSDRAGEHMTRLDPMHAAACKAAGIEKLTLHGLRRSFKSLTEWLDISTGTVAQIMGHKPSATAEKHYTVRSLDFLREKHQLIESWMLEQAKVQYAAPAEPVSTRD